MAAPASGSPEEATSVHEHGAGRSTGASDSDSPTTAQECCQPDAPAGLAPKPDAGAAGGGDDGAGICSTASWPPHSRPAEDANGDVALASASGAAEPAAQPVAAEGSVAEGAVAEQNPAAAPKRRRKLGRSRAVLDSPDPSGPPRSSHARSQVRGPACPPLAILDRGVAPTELEMDVGHRACYPCESVAWHLKRESAQR